VPVTEVVVVPVLEELLEIEAVMTMRCQRTSSVEVPVLEELEVDETADAVTSVGEYLTSFATMPQQ